MSKVKTVKKVAVPFKLMRIVLHLYLTDMRIELHMCYTDCLSTDHQVSSIGCKNDEQRFQDSIDLIMVSQDDPDDGEEVPLMMSVVGNATGDFIIERRVVSKSSEKSFYYKMTSTGGVESGEKDPPEPPPTGARSVRKFKQVYKGVDVYSHGGTYNSVTREPIMAKLADCIFLDLKSTKPKIDIQEAAAIVRKRLKRRFIPTIDDRNSRLYVWIDPDTNKARLVWFLNGIVDIPGKAGFSNVFAYVDALSGKIYSVTDYLESFQAYNMTGDGGNIKIGKRRYGEGKYKDHFLKVTGCADCPKCIASNPFISIYNANNTQYYWEPERCFTVNNPYEEKCNPPSPNADATELSFSQVHDALFFATSFREMLRDVYRDLTLDKCNKETRGQIKICVHYDHRNFTVFKDTGNCEIYFGFGFGFLDPASVTLVGHEMGHALIKVTSNLEYNCQSGGIAEAFSDICAVTLKAYLQDKLDWGVASEITLKNSSQAAVRYMDDPPRDGISIGCTRDYPWDVSCKTMDRTVQDPHRHSGIFNKAFFNLVTIEKWDIMSAFGIFLRATKFYWKATESFDGALCSLIEATIDIYSAEGKNVAFQKATEVSRAFEKVGVICGVTGGKRKNTAKDKIGKKAASIKVKHAPGCPSGWVTFNGLMDTTGAKLTLCFKIIKDVMTWDDAQAHCESLDAHLAVADKEEKTKFLSGQIKKKKEHWIGATDRQKEGEWRWIPTDTSVNETKWNKKQPSNGADENCLALQRLSKKSYGWNDSKCEQKKLFVCERSCCGLSCRNN